jgi:diaminopimelate epimerase
LIHFTKAHACGNDFLIVEASAVPASRQAEAARLFCARTTGVGADGVEFFEWLGEREGRIKLHNADGSVAEISGNGTRCVAAWMARERHAGAGEVLRIQTDAGWRDCRVVSDVNGAYEIVSGMGVPVLREDALLLADGSVVMGARVDTGNPHFVIFVDHPDYGVNSRSWQSIGEEICTHADFPNQTNVEFVRIISKDEIEIRIFERGVGPTSSSGTGTCASGSAAIALRGASHELRVKAPGGMQRVEWADSKAEIFLTGPAVLVATGEALVSLDGGGQ